MQNLMIWLSGWRLNLLCGLAGLALGTSVWLFFPKQVEKEVVKIQTVEVEKIVEKKIEVIKWKDKQTNKSTLIIVKKPDGTTSETHVTENSATTSGEKAKVDEASKEVKKESVVEKLTEKPSDMYALGVQGTGRWSDKSIGLGVTGRVRLGDLPLWVTGSADVVKVFPDQKIDPSISLGVQLSF